MLGKFMEEDHSSIDTGIKKGIWRYLLAFIGQVSLISLDYMDPGNWATVSARGIQPGFRLFWLLLISVLAIYER